MANTVKISVTIITFNEEKNIERCIKSVIPVADEILIVDSFSNDKTKEMALQYPVRFIQNKFTGHIEQKNYALEQAKYNYVLSLDADEALSDELQKSILTVKNNWQHDAYRFNRLTNYCGRWIRHSGWYPDTKIRLVDKHKAKWGGTNPHDKLELISKGSIQHLKGDLLHYSINSVDQHIEIIQKFSTVAAEARFLKGEKSNLLKIIFHPFWKFISIYLLKSGFLDGYHGFLIAKISTFSTFLRYVKLKQYWKTNRK